MTSTKMQGKILDYTTNTSKKNIICKLKTKTIERRQVINKSDFINEDKEIIGKTKGISIEELENVFFEYIDSCNDDNFLFELIDILNTRIKALKIKYVYDGYDEEDEEDEFPDTGSHAFFG